MIYTCKIPLQSTSGVRVDGKMYGLKEHPGRIVIEMWEMTATTAPNVLIDDMQPALSLPRNMYHPMECCMVIAMEDEVSTNEGSHQGPAAIVFILDYACVL